MKTVSVEVSNILNDEEHNVISFKIAAVTRDNGDILNIYRIKYIVLEGEDYDNAISSMEDNEEEYFASLCVLTEEEENKIAFLQSLI